jgi:hypothetical protein
VESEQRKREEERKRTYGGFECGLGLSRCNGRRLPFSPFALLRSHSKQSAINRKGVGKRGRERGRGRRGKVKSKDEERERER